MAKQIAFSRIFNNRRILNYDIYYWNRVKVKYYDGSSFTGDKEEVNPMSSAILKRNLLVELSREALNTCKLYFLFLVLTRL
ncbi:hypothetical protein AHAS_Ahas12G0032300 [Arachis hypogaea]